MPAVVSIIVAHDDQLGIGSSQANSLLWHISADLKHFKKTTLNHPVIMGRKTHQSIGRPLSGRDNIVVTRNPSYLAPGCQLVSSLNLAVKLAQKSSPTQKKINRQEIFIIGGGEIYQQALAKDLVDRLYITKIKGDYKANIFFPNYSSIFTKVIVKKTLQVEGYYLTFLILEKQLSVD